MSINPIPLTLAISLLLMVAPLLLPGDSIAIANEEMSEASAESERAAALKEEPMVYLESLDKKISIRYPRVSSPAWLAEALKAKAKEWYRAQQQDELLYNPELCQYCETHREWSILFVQGKIATVGERASEYMGGAHGASSIQIYTIDLEERGELDLSKMITPEEWRELEILSEPYFRLQNELDSVGVLSDYGFMFENDQFHLAQQYGLTEAGLRFYYNSYEIAPYSMGQFEFTVPYSLLKAVLGKNHHLFSWLETSVREEEH